MRRRARPLHAREPRQQMVSGPARGRHHHRQCAVRLRHRRQHRGRGCVFAHRLSGNAPLRLSARFRARQRRRLRLPWHADPAVGADDRLVRADRIVDRQDVPGRRDTRPARGRRHDRLCRRRGDAEAGTGRRNGDRALARTSARRRCRRRAAPVRRSRTTHRSRAMLVEHLARDPADRRNPERDLARACARRPKAPVSAPSAHSFWR